ncbi:MAG TPA: hypothetical protein PLL53_00620 [Saprospiraceae bacterium]|nr:hypothetical protein [Saprospiraceae bacterium]
MKASTLRLLVALFVLAISFKATAQQPKLQYFRGWDKDAINVFEPTKADDTPYEGFKIRIGGSFTQNFQSLTHENNPTYVPVSTTNPTNRNLLYGVVKAEDSLSATLQGFNLAMANLNFDFQIEDGIRVCLENYMSARHHNEFWVKGGYIQIDKLPMFGNPQWFSDYFRVKIGHFQPNFGDMQFRRSDGGNTMFNPFVENYILDAFATEIGGEVYGFLPGGFMAMVGMSSGFINGNIENYPSTPQGTNKEVTKKTPSVFFKLAYDKTFDNDFRFRLSASMYNNPSIQRNTLYAGDRTGSQYFLMMDPALTNGAATTATAQFTSGRFNPGLTNQINSVMINPFIKFKGLEVFGSYEIAQGRTYAEDLDAKRKFTQLAVEGVYRFLPNESLFVGARYVQASGRPQGFTDDISIDRLAFAAGWFPSKNLLLKAEVVNQNYKDFPTTDYRNEGKFNGFVIQAAIGF